MTENQRETFRLEPDDAGLDAELSWQGRSAPCRLVNLSAGGARVTCALAVPVGSSCRLQVRLHAEQQGAGAPPFATFEMEVLQVSGSDYRLRSVAGPGSEEYEAASKLVFAAQRAMLAQRSGAQQASPMRSDEERRRGFRLPRGRRFGKRSLRPDAD